MALILVGYIIILKLFHFHSKNIVYPSRINEDLKFHVTTVHKSLKDTKREVTLCSSFLKKFMFKYVKFKNILVNFLFLYLWF